MTTNQSTPVSQPKWRGTIHSYHSSGRGKVLVGSVLLDFSTEQIRSLVCPEVGDSVEATFLRDDPSVLQSLRTVSAHGLELETLATELLSVPQSSRGDLVIQGLGTVARELMYSLDVPGLELGVEVATTQAYQEFRLYVKTTSKETLVKVTLLPYNSNFPVDILSPVCLSDTKCLDLERLPQDVAAFIGRQDTIKERLRYHITIAKSTYDF